MNLNKMKKSELVNLVSTLQARHVADRAEYWRMQDSICRFTLPTSEPVFSIVGHFAADARVRDVPYGPPTENYHTFNACLCGYNLDGDQLVVFRFGPEGNAFGISERDWTELKRKVDAGLAEAHKKDDELTRVTR